MKAVKILIQLAVSVTLILIFTFLVRNSGYSPHMVNTQLYFYKFDTKYHYGDNPDWSDPNYIDRNWPGFLKDTDTMLWVREKINIPHSIDQFETAGLHVSFLASYELFWDGYLIGRNGMPGFEKESEVEGQLMKVFHIPDTLAKPGVHIVAFRASNHFADNRIRHFSVKLGDFSMLSTRPIIFTSFMYILAGIFLVISFITFSSILIVIDKPNFYYLDYCVSSSFS